MKFVFALLAMFAGLIYWMLNGEPRYVDTVLVHMPVDDRSEMAKDVEKVGGEMDYDISSDGNGSLRIDARERVLVDLYRVWGNEEDLSFRQLVYEAKVRTEQASAPVFLVMQAGLTSAPHGMPVVGRDKAIHGTNDWTTLQIWAGNPPGTRLLETTLQLEIDGPGTVWIDDVRLISRQTI
jgi:hypothetical protein